MERRLSVALSVTVRTAAVKHNFAGGHPSTGKQNDVILLNNARASAFTNSLMIMRFVSLIVQGSASALLASLAIEPTRIKEPAL
jgi:hypothetical protein